MWLLWFSLVLFIFSKELQKTKCFTIPKVGQFSSLESTRPDECAARSSTGKAGLVETTMICWRDQFPSSERKGMIHFWQCALDHSKVNQTFGPADFMQRCCLYGQMLEYNWSTTTKGNEWFICEGHGEPHCCK